MTRFVCSRCGVEARATTAGWPVGWVSGKATSKGVTRWFCGACAVEVRKLAALGLGRLLLLLRWRTA